MIPLVFIFMVVVGVSISALLVVLETGWPIIPRFAKKKIPVEPSPELFPRATPFDELSESVFNDWLRITDGRDLTEYCQMETRAERDVREGEWYLNQMKEAWPTPKYYRKFKETKHYSKYVEVDSPGITSSIYTHRPGDFNPPFARTKTVEEQQMVSDAIDQILKELQ